METYTIGYDAGFSYAICSGEKKNLIMKNYIQVIPESRAKEIAENIDSIHSEGEDKIIIKYKGEYFLCGDLAVLYEADIEHRRSDGLNRIEDKHFLVEHLALMGVYTSETEFNVNVAVGLALKDKVYGASYKKMLRNTFEFSYLTSNGEISKKIHVKNVECLSQPYAVQFALPKEKLEEIRKKGKSLMVLDVGFNTLDAVLIKNYSVIKTKDADGVCRLRDNLLDQLRNSKGERNGITRYSERQLEQIIETLTYDLEEDPRDISGELKFVFDEYSDYVFSKTENDFQRHLPTVAAFVGAGGIFNNQQFKENLVDRFKMGYNKSFLVMNDSQLIVAYGLYNFGKMKFKETKANPIKSLGKSIDIDKKEKEVAIGNGK